MENKVPLTAVAATESETPTPTLTHYQEVAQNFINSIDELEKAVPKLELPHDLTKDFVRRRQNIPIQFLSTAVAAVEQTPELQAVRKLDVTEARDTLQFIEAFRPVLDRVVAFGDRVRHTIRARRALLAKDALQIYSIGKGVARDADGAEAASHVQMMKRDLGRHGSTKKKTTEVPTTKSAA